MVFTSYEFLLFFPIVVIAYFLIPQKLRWCWLLLSSYYYYMSWNPKFALLIGTSTVITYLSGLWIGRANKLEDERKKTRSKKLAVTVSLILNLGILCYFKYTNFLLDSIHTVLLNWHIAINVPAFDIILPVGISFYTLQALTYTIDVYRGDIAPTKNIGKYALFVSFFPQLLSGPIQRAKDFLPQFDEVHKFDYTRMKRGLMLMLWGFFLKLVVSDRIATLVNTVYNNHNMYMGFELILATILFSVQIYCDFSGYSCIAIGAAEVMGFRLTDNFKRPYFAKSVSEFWRRWHISLTSWFRNYLYFPLGGNRVSKWKRYRNVMIVFVTSGLWHGANWNFVIWGMLHGGYQIAELSSKSIREKAIKKFNVDKSSFSHKAYSVLLTFILVSFAWIFFRANTLKDAVEIIQRSFYLNPWIFTDGSLLNMGLNALEIVISIVGIGVLVIASLLGRQESVRDKLMRQGISFQWIVLLLGIFAIITFGNYGPSYDPGLFIYFKF